MVNCNDHKENADKVSEHYLKKHMYNERDLNIITILWLVEIALDALLDKLLIYVMTAVLLMDTHTKRRKLSKLNPMLNIYMSILARLIYDLTNNPRND